MSVIREVHAEGWSVRLDLAPQVLAIDVPAHNFVSWREDSLSPAVPLAFDGFVSAAALLWNPHRNRAGDIFLQVLTHSSYHRGQLALLLGQEQKAPPATDYIFYLRERGL